jgi:hypothetical protein
MRDIVINFKEKAGISNLGPGLNDFTLDLSSTYDTYHTYNGIHYMGLLSQGIKLLTIKLI